MQFKKFILPLADDGTQEEELNRFLRGHRVLKVEQHFLEADAVWAMLVSYLDGEQNDTARPATRGGDHYDGEKELQGEPLERYRRMAAVRREMARAVGVKAYLIFNNRELGELAQADALTPETLLALRGYGEGRLKQYGTDFIARLNERVAAEAQADSHAEAVLQEMVAGDATGGTSDGADYPF